MPETQREFGKKIKEGINTGRFFIRAKNNEGKRIAKIEKILTDILYS